MREEQKHFHFITIILELHVATSFPLRLFSLVGIIEHAGAGMLATGALEIGLSPGQGVPAMRENYSSGHQREMGAEFLSYCWLVLSVRKRDLKPCSGSEDACQRQGKAEGTAFPFLALDTEFAAHQFDQLAGNGQAEAGAAKVTGS